MAFKLSDLLVKLRLDNKQYNTELQESGKKTSSFGKGIKKIGGLIAGAFAVGAVTNFAKEAVKAFDIQAQAENQLLVALKGRRDVQRDLINQARELQGETLFGDEETIRAQALIAAFVKEADQIKQIIPLVQDLATAKGMQLSAAADLVSKTLGSSTNALSRYGIEVEGTVGSVERLESLMGGLNDAFGGQAASAAKVGTGALKQLGNAFGDLKEVIGELIIEQQNQQSSLTKLLTTGVNRVTGFFEKVSTLRKTGLDFKTSLAGAIFGTEEDFNMVEHALASAEQKTVKVADTVIKKAKEVKREGSIFGAMGGMFGTPSVGSETELPTGLADMSGFMGKQKESAAKTQKEINDSILAEEQMFVDHMNGILSSGMADFVSTFAEGIGKLASGDIGLGDFFDAILSQIGGFLSTFGKALVAYGIAEAAFMKSFDPVSKIAAGAALIAIGGFIGGLGSKGPQGFSGGTSAVSSSSFSGVASASQLQDDRNYTFELQGTKLIGVINNTNRRNTSIR